MKRWNGWGNIKTEMRPPEGAVQMLAELIGTPKPAKSVPREAFIQKVPSSRLTKGISCITDDAGQRLDHAHGQSFPDWVNIRMGTLTRFPDAVAFPESENDIEQLMELIDSEDLMAIPYGGGTSVVGHLDVPESDRPVISVSMERMKRMVFLDPVCRLATFEAGINGVEVEAALRPHGFTLGHYPQSFEYSTLGGWVVTRSSGQQSLFFGRIEDMFAGGRVFSPKGVLEFLPHPATAAGPDLRQLFLGSEGRMGIITKASVRIRPIPERDDIYGVFLPTWEAAVSCVRELVAAGLPLSMIRLSNPRETETNLILAGHEKEIEMLKRYLRIRGFYDSAYCMALIGLIGSKKAVSSGMSAAKKIIKKYRGIVVGKSMGNAWKKNRFLAPYLRNSLWDLGYGVDTLETAVTWDKVTETMKRIEAAIIDAGAEKNENVHVFTHLSHIYPTGSSIYTTYLFRLKETSEETLELWRSMKDAASRVIVEAGGTISHQHGVGTDHRQYLPAEKGELGISILKGIFSNIDPGQAWNPGKLTE